MATKQSLSGGQQGKGGKKRKTGEDQIPPNNPSTSDEEQKKRKYWPGKIFNDPIHGHIEIPAVCVKIIDTPQFQRLRSIKQVGGTYFVYPGASHNRFEHSLGVCHLAGQLVSALKAQQPDLEISEDDVMCLQIAGLCHDLGHGPFSHMFDKRFLPNMKIQTKHESLSVKMFNHMVKENNLDDEFKKYFREDLDKNKTFIKELIERRSKNERQVWSYKGRGKEKSFLYEIVANKRNGIDVDKWDYFARDCHMLGIRNSFDHTRSMKFARVLRFKDELQICFRNKEVENLYEMFHTRNKLHRQAYQHPVGNIIEIMISEAMQKADQHIRTPGKEGKMLSITETLDDMEAYEKLTDSIIDRIFCSTDENMKESREILMKVKKRQLYKCVGCIHPPEKIDEKTVKQGYVEMLKKRGSKLGTGDVIIDPVFFNYGMKDKILIDHVHFYKKDNPDKAIEVKKEEVSGMLPERFAEQQIRFYCKLDDNESLQQAKAALTDWCKNNNCATQVRDSSAVYGNKTAPEEISNRSQPREAQAINSTCGIEKLTHLWYRDFHYPALALPKEIEKHISQSSKGCRLLQYVIDEFLSKVQSVTHGLRTETEMRMPENVIACNVNVKRINNQIQVDIEDTDNWNRLLLPDSEKIIKVILIQSRSLYVIEAKLSVYREFQREIDSANIFLLHLLEDYDEVAKLSLYHTVDYFCTFIEIIQDVLRIKRLDEILENSIADVSTKNPSDLCNDDFVRDAEDSIAESAEKAMTSIKTYHSNTDEGEIENAIEYANRVIGEHLSMNISTEIKNQFIMQTNNTSQKYRLFSAVELQNELSCLISETMKHALYLGLTNLTSPTGCKYDQLQHHARERKITVPFQLSAFVCDVNSREWREKLAEKVLEIVSLNQREIILAIGKEIREFCETKQNALKTFSFSLRKFQSKIQLAVQKEVVATWQKREVIEDKTLENHPSVLRYIAGMKNNTPSVKVFLRQDDETSMAFFQNLPLQKDTVIEFVNIMSLPTKNKKEQKTVKNNRTDISKVTRDKLNNILSRHAESLYANHSNVVGLGISEVMFKGDKTIAEPCIVMHCLDETLVPYGEKQLPLDIEGIPCDIREGIFIFGCCVNCRDRNPNPGCSISRQFDVSTGSVGFLVKSKKTSDTGFLTAAHVAIEEVGNLYDTALLLSQCKQHPDYDFARRQLNIVHPSWEQGAENYVIGEVVESFLGNVDDQTGIDAAFVLTCQQRLGEKTEIQIADDRSLTVDGNTRVTKIGQTTGKTYGRLVETNFSTSIPGDSSGTFFTFKNCYRIENEDDDKPFFKPGDSGSGVFWSESKTLLKSLGIAFACNAYDQSTVVCRIEPIINAFALSLYKEDDEMDQ